jgi:3-dehydroquinate synthetase
VLDFSYAVRPPAETTRVLVGPLTELPLQAAAETGCLVADERAMAAWGDRLLAFASRAIRRPSEPVTLPGGEGVKDLETVARLWDALFARGLDRGSLLLAAGGGAVLDACGFAAAAFLRGIPFGSVPTTLLAQVDAAIGGKCGVNAGRVKNQIGAVRQPRFVAVDLAFAAGLPDADFRSGLGEIAKTALLAGGDLHDLIERAAGALRARDPATLEQAVVLALRFKAGVVERDPFDRGERASLNAGHTVGHAFEAEAARRGIALAHGDAVAIGLALEARAHDAADPACVLAMLRRLGLPEAPPFAMEADAARALVARDKKRRDGVVVLPVVEAPGRISLREVGVERIVRVITGGA